MNNQKKIESNIDVKRKQLIAKLTYDLPVLRARIGVSQEKLAEKIGISRQTYNTIENGKKEMPWITFMALVAVFQNNAETNKMLLNIEGIEDELTNISAAKNSPTEISRHSL